MLEQHEPKIYAPIATNTDIPRDIRDRFADIINLLDYGTNTAAFKKAKLAAKNKGAVVYVPAGTYTLTENISDNTEDTNINAHTFVTLGHVDTGNKCYVLDLSKAVTTDMFNPNTVFDDGKNIIYLNSNGQVDIHYDGGLQPVTSGGIQYLGVKAKDGSPITVDNNGVGLNYGNGLKVVDNTLKAKEDSNSPIQVTSSGIGFNPGNNSPIVYSGGKLNINTGTGLEVTSGGVLNCTVTVPEQTTYSAGDGITISNNTISANVDGSTIGFNDGALSFIGSLNGLTVSDIPYMQGASNTLFAKQVDFGNMLLMYGVSQIGTGTHNLVITNTDPFNVPYDSSFPNGTKLEPTFYVSFSGQLAHAGWIYDSGVYGFKISNSTTEEEITNGKNYFWFGFGPKQ